MTIHEHIWESGTGYCRHVTRNKGTITLMAVIILMEAADLNFILKLLLKLHKHAKRN